MKNLREIKTTTIGIILIALSIFSYLYREYPDTVEGIIFILGVAFLFFADDFLKTLRLGIKRVITRKSKDI